MRGTPQALSAVQEHYAGSVGLRSHIVVETLEVLGGGIAEILNL